MSRFDVQEAKREHVYLKIAVEGPSGSGKTMSSLLLAYGLCRDWSRVCLADTENRSALYYPGQTVKVTNAKGDVSETTIGNFKHIDFQPPYMPEDYIGLIDSIVSNKDIDVLVIDSISPEWAGCLDLQNRLGGQFKDWAKVSPLHAKFVDKIRLCEKHLIATMRSKQDYVIETNEKGKAAPRKVGLKAEQREGTDYEFGLVFTVDMQHRARAGKDRTNLFNTEFPFQLTPAIGAKLAAWSCDGSNK